MLIFFRLWLRDKARRLKNHLKALISVFVERAEQYVVIQIRDGGLNRNFKVQVLLKGLAVFNERGR